jgi:hypothetical protein
VSQFHQAAGQSLKDIGQAAGFGIGQRFGGYKEYAHEQNEFPTLSDAGESVKHVNS